MCTSLATQVLDVHIDTEPRIVSEIVARVVWIIVQNNVVAGQVPTVHVRQVGPCNAEIEAVEEESVGTASTQPVDVTATNMARVVPVLPRPIQMVSRAATLVTNPASARVNVRRIGMTRRVVKIRVTLVSVVEIRTALRWPAMIATARFGAALWDVTATEPPALHRSTATVHLSAAMLPGAASAVHVTSAMAAAIMLSKHRNGK